MTFGTSQEGKGNGDFGGHPNYSAETSFRTQAKILEEILEKRQILASTSDDLLRWGRNNEGNFNVKEAKIIITRFDYSNPEKTWKNIWSNPHWMKIKMFIWLVVHRKILTWENLRKRGFVRPSKCHLCGLQEETTNHLLNMCEFTSSIWNWVASIFNQIDRKENDIMKTLKTWRKYFSENETINVA